MPSTVATRRRPLLSAFPGDESPGYVLAPPCGWVSRAFSIAALAARERRPVLQRGYSTDEWKSRRVATPGVVAGRSRARPATHLNRRYATETVVVRLSRR